MVGFSFISRKIAIQLQFWPSCLSQFVKINSSERLQLKGIEIMHGQNNRIFLEKKINHALT